MKCPISCSLLVRWPDASMVFVRCVNCATVYRARPVRKGHYPRDHPSGEPRWNQERAA